MTKLCKFFIRLSLGCSLLMMGACDLLKKGDHKASAGTTDGGTGTTVTPKAIASNDWESGAFRIDLHNAITDGTTFHATRYVSTNSQCDCVMTMTGDSNSGTYTSACTLTSGSPASDCTDFNTAGRTCAGASSSWSAPNYTHGTATINFGICGAGSSGLTFE